MATVDGAASRCGSSGTVCAAQCRFCSRCTPRQLSDRATSPLSLLPLRFHFEISHKNTKSTLRGPPCIIDRVGRGTRRRSLAERTNLTASPVPLSTLTHHRTP